MVVGTIARRWDEVWDAWHAMRRETTLARKIALALGMAALTGLAAQMRIPVPWSPVPITGQTCAVLLSGILLGRSWGGVSQALYVALGVVGVPWFSGWSGGVGALLGPTGGYLIGFILAAFLLGRTVDAVASGRRFVPLLGLVALADYVLIYIPGLVQLCMWLRFAKGEPVSLGSLLLMGCVPFLLGDALKILVAALVGTAIAPRDRS
jgi:biotin transport system substrate-specific component